VPCAANAHRLAQWPNAPEGRVASVGRAAQDRWDRLPSHAEACPDRRAMLISPGLAERDLPSVRVMVARHAIAVIATIVHATALIAIVWTKTATAMEIVRRPAASSETVMTTT